MSKNLFTPQNTNEIKFVICFNNLSPSGTITYVASQFYWCYNVLC